MPMVEYPQRSTWRERLLGGRDSWRRVVLAGIGGGLLFAIVGAFAVAFINDSGSSALDKKEPTAIAPSGGPIVEEPPVEEFPTEPVEEFPTDIPTEPVPTEPVFEEPTPEPTFEPLPTEPVAAPTEPAAGLPLPDLLP